MGKNAVKSIREMTEMPSSRGACEGHLVPGEARNSATFESSSAIDNGYMVPQRQKPGSRALLDGNFARHSLPLRESEYCIWDVELAGFGLRVRPTGNYYWFVRLRHRGKHRRITLGRSDELYAGLARAQARRLLAEVALDGLPKRAVVKATPVLSDFVETYWDDLSRVWMASTNKRNWNAWKNVIAQEFGAMRVADILPADIHRWRDNCAGAREGLFNRALPVLASLLKYAEALRLRRKGSNPCRGMPRYKRAAMERYLTPAEYCRLGTALREEEVTYPSQVAIVHLLLFTGARVGEILNLRWNGCRHRDCYCPTARPGQRLSGSTVRRSKSLRAWSGEKTYRSSFRTAAARSRSSSTTGGCRSDGVAPCPMSAFTIYGIASRPRRSWTTCRWRPSANCWATSCRKPPPNTPTCPMM